MADTTPRESVIESLRRQLTVSSRQSAPGATQGMDESIDVDVGVGVIRPDQRLPLPPSQDTSKDATPIMSALPSSANLLGMDKKKSQIRRLPRQISECVTLPLPAPAKRKRMMKPVLAGLARLPVLLLLLYLFICSLDLLTTSFRLIAGKAAGSIFQGNPLLGNPIVGLMIGVLFTVLVQSSSTCTSVIVSMVSSGILDVRTAIPMVMGANIGTSLTSTLVSLTSASDKEQFERAFAGATVHDCFNWLTVITLLALETSTGYLYNLTLWLVNSGSNGDGQGSDNAHIDKVMGPPPSSMGVGGGKPVNLLGALTKPLTKRVVQIEKSVLKCWGLGECQDERLLKVWCGQKTVEGNLEGNVTASGEEELLGGEKCPFLVNYLSDAWSDQTIGLVLLLVALAMLTSCLILIVKVLRALMQGSVADLIRKFINADIPYVPWLTGYLAILMGAILTFIVQSSSVFTSTLTPLVGVGLIKVDRVYPLTLGSNLGTTTTALLASLAADPATFRNAVQIALCHLVFNLTGILIFYPLPVMRWPLVLCKILGRTTAQYRWFAVFYLVFMFFLLPVCVLSLSLAGEAIFYCVGAPVLAGFLVVVVLNVLQVKVPGYLPHWMRTWNYLPLWMRSLDPWDAVLKKMGRCCGDKYSEIPSQPTQSTLEAVIVENREPEQ